MTVQHCDCTSLHRHCENQPKIEEIDAGYAKQIKAINEEYIRRREEIDEPVASAPGTPRPIVINSYDSGLGVSDEFLVFLRELLKNTCPHCGRIYQKAVILTRSFGPGVVTTVACLFCHGATTIPEYSDI